MYYRNLSLILLLQTLLVLFINLTLGNKNVPCTRTGPCKCEFPNGMGVDLTFLKGEEFNISGKRDEFILFYPCNNFNVTNNVTLNECGAGVSLCLEKYIGNETKLLNFGSLNESVFQWENINENPIINFNHATRTTSIQLVCSADAKVPSLASDKIFNDHYELKLTSKYACPTTVTDDGPSVFSTFFLIVLILFLFYLVSGFLVLRFIRGARGWEAIPNGDFWKSTLSSLRNMCFYFLRGCHNPEVYDTI